MSTAPVFKEGEVVRYMGRQARVIIGNQPVPDWGLEEPQRTINVEFTGDIPRDWSRQQDVLATACVSWRDS